MSNPILNFMHKTHQHVMTVKRGRLILWSLTLWLLTLSLFISFDLVWTNVMYQHLGVADQVFQLPVLLRWCFCIFLFAWLLFTVLFLLIGKREINTAYFNYAKDYQMKQNIDCDQLINALSFELAQVKNTTLTDPLTQALVKRSHSVAIQSISSLKPRFIYPYRNLFKCTIGCLIMFLALLLSFLSFPDQTNALITRVLTPWRAVAPVTTTPHRVTVSNSSPNEGDLVSIQVADLKPETQAYLWITHDGHPHHGEIKTPLITMNKDTDTTRFWRVKTNDQSTRFFVIANGTWSGPHMITPEIRPRFLSVQLEVTHINQWIRLPFPTTKRYVLTEGSMLRITVTSDQPNAYLKQSVDQSLTLNYRVKSGPQWVELSLTNDEGLTSLDRIALSIRGIQVPLGEEAPEPSLEEVDPENMTKRLADFNDPNLDGPKADDMIKENTGEQSPKATRTGQGNAKTRVEDLLNADDNATDNDTSPQAVADPKLVDGDTTEQLSTMTSPDTVSGSFSATAPPRYRQQVEQYHEALQKNP